MLPIGMPGIASPMAFKWAPVFYWSLSSWRIFIASEWWKVPNRDGFDYAVSRPSEKSCFLSPLRALLCPYIIRKHIYISFIMELALDSLGRAVPWVVWPSPFRFCLQVLPSNTYFQHITLVHLNGWEIWGRFKVRDPKPKRKQTNSLKPT